MQNSKITWVGCDVSKDKFNVAVKLPVVPEKHSSVKEISVDEFLLTEGGVAGFKNWLFYLKGKVGAEAVAVHVVMEATGRYSKQLYILMRKEMPKILVSIENPKNICNYIKSLKHKNKTDNLDAKALLQYGFERKPKLYNELPVEYEHLRELTRQRTAMDLQLTAAKLRFKEISTFDDIAKIQRQVINVLKKGIAKVEKLIRECVEQSQELSESVDHATTIQGVGFITATTVLAECGPLYEHSSRELSAYSGLAPYLRQSGTSVNSSKISHAGPRRLRQVLYMASIVVTKYDGPLRNIYKRLIRQGRKPMQARCAVMRKLLILIRAVVVNKTAYFVEYKKAEVFHNVA